MNNKVYDVLKWIALVALPALTTFWIAIAKIWEIPYGEPIAATITAFTALLGALLGVSSVIYAKKLESNKEETDG